jgi:hypothetical protein
MTVTPTEEYRTRRNAVLSEVADFDATHRHGNPYEYLARSKGGLRPPPAIPWKGAGKNEAYKVFVFFRFVSFISF